MKKVMVIAAVMGLIIVNCNTAFSAKDNVWEEMGRGHLNLNAVLVDGDNPDIIYIGSDSGIFKSEDNAQAWRMILSVRGQNRNVNFLIFDPQDKNGLYAATGNGVFYSNSQGRHWRRIFRGRSGPENDCSAIAASGPVLYLGTRAGLFISKDQGLSWQRSLGKLGSSQIVSVAADKNVQSGIVYVACSEGLFKSRDKGESWVKIFTANPAENNHQLQDDQEEEREAKNSNLRYILVEPGNPDFLYLATSEGIYKSKDRGNSWETFTTYGMLGRDVKFMLISEGSGFFVLTKSAVYEYRNERWQEISFGLASSDIRFIALDKRCNFYAACDKGLFKTSLADGNGTKNDLISLYLNDEPDIRKVQQAAIAYAEVHPDKIKTWRKQAAQKAMLPQVNLGLNRNVTDLWHWETGSGTKAEDDVLRKGNDVIEWDVTLSWDLSGLIWNNDQTSIDSRSKLMSELRDNILDEINRLYFERIRLKMELDSLSIEDRKKRWDRELRLKELAASLDALTDGYFSQSQAQ